MVSAKRNFYVGTASWTIPKLARDMFFAADAVKPSHLAAYAEKFCGVEINSSFYREHQTKTYEKWAAAVPKNFRFSVKLAKRFTHLQKLKVDTADLQSVIEGISGLADKLGVILVQLPPKLSFDEGVAEDFFASLRELHDGGIALEARHESWVAKAATNILEDHRIARVIADPDRIGEAPAIKSADLAYFRLHGSPKVYYSDYEPKELKAWKAKIVEASKQARSCWCIFDNTALGFATLNALKMRDLLKF